MEHLVVPIGLLGAFLGLACLVWLHIRTVKDGMAPDILLLCSGVSVVAYVFTRWDRAKWPFLGTVIGFALMFLAALLR